MDTLKIHPLKFLSQSIPQVAVTGGPCAGKTSILAKAKQALQDMGICVGIVPELATEFIMQGFKPGGSVTPESFQEAILLGTIERLYRMQGLMGTIEAPRKVILSDRGLLDGSAYMDPDAFFAMARRYGYEPSYLSAMAHKAVIHLRSTAFDVPDIYEANRTNNPARHETLAEAKALDQRTLDTWSSHPHLRIIGNVDLKGKPISLEQKTRLFVAEVAHVLGIPVPVEIERKFALKKMPNIPVYHESVEIAQYYLAGPDEERIRLRNWRGSPVCYRTIKKPYGSGVRSEIERIVPNGEFAGRMADIKPGSRVITKDRISFVWENQYFELDVFTGFHHGLILLEIELTEANRELAMPPWISDHTEVTHDGRFFNAALATTADRYW